MNEAQIACMVLGFAVLGIGAAVIHILQTPRKERYWFHRQKPMTEQLVAYPENVEAVLVKGDKKRFLLLCSPVILIGAPLIIFTVFLHVTDEAICTNLFGINVSIIALVEISYVVPILALIATLLYCEVGIRSLKSGYFPPLDSVLFSDTIAKKGFVSRIRGVAFVLSPLLGIFLVYQGHQAYMQITDGLTYEEFSGKLQIECA